MKTVITGKTCDEERAFYNLTDAEVSRCTFAGPADGESAFKEARRIDVSDCTFALRYPFWHTVDFTVSRCRLEEGCRASLWYAKNGLLEDCTVLGVKCLRECGGMTLRRVTAVSPEFGWRCRSVTLEDCTVTSEYCLFESEELDISRLTLRGKYSFQYTKNVVVRDSELDTKDAFWHSVNARVENCTVKGEYLGWYSDGLTLVNCRIIGTQPLCYCRNLTLENCTMEETDLSFECSDVHAAVRGSILSVKNPKSGRISADSIGQIVREPCPMVCTAVIEAGGKIVKW